MQLFLVLFVIFMDHVGFGLVYPIFSSMLFQEGSAFVDPAMSVGTRGWILGLLLAVPAIVTFFSGPVLGAMSDQKGRRPLYLFSLLLAVFGYVACMVSVYLNSVLLLIIARAITGIAAGNAAVVSATVVDLSNDENKAKNFGLYSMAAGIGFAIGPFLGGWLASFGLIVPFFVSACAVAINLSLIFFLFKETNVLKKEGSIKVVEGISNLKKAFKIPELRILFLAVVFFCCGWSLFYEFLPVLWITDYGLSLKEVGFFFAFGSAVYALSSGVLIRPIVDRFHPFSILIYSMGGMGICILLLLLNPTYPWIFGYMPVINFLIALAYPTYTTLVSNSCAKDSQGEILGVLESVQSTAFGLSPLFAGYLLGIHIHVPMLIGGLCMFIATAFLVLHSRRALRGDRKTEAKEAAVLER